jgi:hypothetical protein
VNSVKNNDRSLVQPLAESEEGSGGAQETLL